MALNSIRLLILAILLSLSSLGAFGASVKIKYSPMPKSPSVIFNAGDCIFPDGENIRCLSDKYELKEQRILNRGVTDALEEIRNECVWFDILEVDTASTAKNKRTLFDQEGYAIGDYAEKYIRAEVRYICEEPIS